MTNKKSACFFTLLWIISSIYGQDINTWNNFGNDIKAYVYQSIDQPPVPGCTLFAGSSSFRMWEDLEDRFADYEAVNRAFGGSQYPDNLAVMDLLHLPCRPSKVVLFCGTNDIASGTSVEQTFQNFKYYIARLWNANPLMELFFVSITHAPARGKFWKAGDEFNAKVMQLAHEIQGLHYIDMITPLSDKKGNARPELWLPDRLHPTKECYLIWETVIKKALEKQQKSENPKIKADIRHLFNRRKSAGLWDEPRFSSDGITVNEPPQADRNLNIVFVGDPTVLDGGTQSPPARCAEYLQQQAGIGKVTFKVLEAADPLPADHNKGGLLFFLVTGTGNSAVEGTDGAPVSPEEYRNKVKEIVDNLLEAYPQCKIFLHRPVRMGAMTYAAELQTLVDYYTKTSSAQRVFTGDANVSNRDVLGRFWGAALFDKIDHSAQ